MEFLLEINLKQLKLTLSFIFRLQFHSFGKMLLNADSIGQMLNALLWFQQYI